MKSNRSNKMQREKTKALEIDGMLVSTFKEPYNELLDEAPNGTYTFHVSSQTDQDKVYLVIELGL